MKKEKVPITYSSKQELIEMIVRLWVEADSAHQLKLIRFLVSNYRGVNLSSVKTLNEMAYDDLEKMYLGMHFVMSENVIIR